MLTKFKDSNDMNTLASNDINSYIKDGYRIDAKESAIDRDKDKGCTFKAVLKKDVDGIECKTVIKLTDNGDDKNKSCTYHKVETVGDTKWSEETRTYSSSTAASVIKETSDYHQNSWQQNEHNKNTNEIEDAWLNDHPLIKSIFRDFSHFDKNENNEEKTSTKWECKCPSAFQRLDDYIKFNDKKDEDDVKIKFTAPDGKEVEAVDLHNKSVKAELAKDTHIEGDGTVHIKVNSNDSMDDIYKGIVDRKKNLEEAFNAKARVDKQEEKSVDEDEVEDSLIKLVRYIFGM